MEERDKPIGVFDSGIGGLTVLEELIKRFPNEKFIYIADRKYCPYGIKTAEQIRGRVQKVTSFLLNKAVKAIVVACNTSSVHISSARELTDKPVIGVIEPACANAVKVTKNKRVAVLATLSTVNSGIYQKLLAKEGITPVTLACGEFVDFLENNGVDDPSGEKIVAQKLQALKDSGIDTLIHGCTHFSLLEGHMRKVLGDKITYISCGAPTADCLEKILYKNNLLGYQNGKGSVIIYTTGDRDRAEHSMKWFASPHSPVQHVDID